MDRTDWFRQLWTISAINVQINFASHGTSILLSRIQVNLATYLMTQSG